VKTCDSATIRDAVAGFAGSNLFLVCFPRISLAKPRSILGYMLTPAFAG